MRSKNILSSKVSVLTGVALLGGVGWLTAEKADAHAQRTIEEGMRIFRFDTFGSEAFWGDGRRARAPAARGRRASRRRRQVR
jgi:hypothetical protein